MHSESPPGTPSPRVLARRLVEREAGERDAPDMMAAAAEGANVRVYRALSRWLGSHGTHTIFSRALAKTSSEHSVLAGVKLRDRSHPGLDGVSDSIELHGDSTVAKALEALLVESLDLLGRLIGQDVAAQLVQRRERESPSDDEDLRMTNA